MAESAGTGTPYADWPPLSESSDEMTINRWYGIYFDRERMSDLRRFHLDSCRELRLDLNKLTYFPLHRGCAVRTCKGLILVELTSDFKTFLSSIQPGDDE